MTPPEFNKRADSIAKKTEVPLCSSSIGSSAIKIAASIAIGAFLVWVVKFDLVLEVMAAVFLLGCGALGALVGYWVFKGLSDSDPRLIRMTVAIIIGTSVAITMLELTHSHKLIRAYEYWSSDNQE